MFTGIIECVGEVSALEWRSGEMRLAIHPRCAMENISDGESIAINGVCLSVEWHSRGQFSAYASQETVGRTNFRSLAAGSIVNLERALELGARLGGHIVSGHVDCVARLASVAKAGESLAMRFVFPLRLGPQVVVKGSVALNGISLTVNACGPDFLEVNVIPDSQKRSNIASWRPGDGINMETDIIGKYVEHMLAPWQDGGISRDFLAMHGFA